MKRIIAALVLLIHVGALVMVLKFFSTDHLEIWRNTVPMEAEMINFTFDQEVQGELEVAYEWGDSTYHSSLDGFFSDFERGQTVHILVFKDQPSNIYWRSPLRFWFIEFIVFIFWAVLLIIFTNSFFPFFHLYQRFVIGAALCLMALIIGIFLYRNYQSVGAFRAASHPVLATVASVTEEVCTREVSDDQVEHYPCYRPTYRYGVGRQPYSFEAIHTTEERPEIGQVKELWYWEENPAVARDLSKTLPSWLFFLLVAILSLILLFSLWNLIMHRRPFDY